MQSTEARPSRRRRNPAASNAGFSLAELLVTMMVGVILLGIVGVIFMMILNHQRQVVDTTEVSSQSQAAFRGIQGTVRNSGSASNAIHISADGNFLVANTRGIASTGGTLCEAWYFQPSSDAAGGGTLWFKRTNLTPIDQPTESELDSWIRFVDNIARVDWESSNTSPVFSFAADDAGDDDPSLVSVEFIGTRDQRTGTTGAVSFERTIAKLPQEFGGGNKCYLP